MLSGDKGLSITTLLDPAAVTAFVQTYLEPANNLPKELVANFNRIVPALTKSVNLTQIYSHQKFLQLLCEAMFSEHPDMHLLDAKNLPLQLDSLWRLILDNHSSRQLPLRTVYNRPFLSYYGNEVDKQDGPFIHFTLEQLRELYCDEHLFLGYFAFLLLQKNQNQSDLSEVIEWISKRTSIVVQAEKPDHLRKRTAPSKEDITEHIVNIGILMQHPGSTQYAFYDDRFKYYFAAHFVAACMMRHKDQEDLIDAAIIESVQQFIADNRENTFLDEFWFLVYAAFPPHTGAHARAEFSRHSITTRAECSLFLENLFKLTELELPDKFLFQLVSSGNNQFSIKSPRTTQSAELHVFDFFNNVYIHFKSRGICKLIATNHTSELIFSSQSAQEIQNIAFAFKQALGKWAQSMPSPANLFAGDGIKEVQAKEHHNTASAKH